MTNWNHPPSREWAFEIVLMELKDRLNQIDAIIAELNALKAAKIDAIRALAQKE